MPNRPESSLGRIDSLSDEARRQAESNKKIAEAYKLAVGNRENAALLNRAVSAMGVPVF